MSFKEEVLKFLEEECDVTPQTVADGMAHVIRGETIKEKHVIDDAGILRLVQRDILRTPRDVMNGAMIYDAMRGGDLGIAPRGLRETSGARNIEVAHRRLSVDNRIVANDYDDNNNNNIFGSINHDNEINSINSMKATRTHNGFHTIDAIDINDDDET